MADEPHIRPVDGKLDERVGPRDRRRPRFRRTSIGELAEDVEQVVQDLWTENDDLRRGWGVLAKELHALTRSFERFSIKIELIASKLSVRQNLLFALLGAACAVLFTSVLQAWFAGYMAERNLTMAEARIHAIAEALEEVPQGIAYRLPANSTRAGYPRVHVLQGHPALEHVRGITALERDRACELVPPSCRWDP